jgi:DNA excision repair protein ERCC-2
MRNAAQCVGRVLRGKTDWGLMVFADRVRNAQQAETRLTRLFQRFARADKRSKLPKWINQYITENASNLSTDMAIVLSKSFMRTISQNTNENLQTGISLWTLEDVLKEQLKQKQAQAMYQEPPSVGARMEIDDEYDDGGLPDEMLAAADLGL